MPERIPELDHLAVQAEEVPMLPASEIRRRGDRRRTVRRASIAGVAALATVALGFGVWGSPLMDATREPEWANTAVQSPEPSEEPTPEPSPSAEPTPSEEPAPTPPVTTEPTSTPEFTTPEVTPDTPTAEPSVDPSLPGTATVTEPSVEPATWDNVPTAAEIVQEWEPVQPTVTEWEGKGQAAIGLCDPGEFGSPVAHLVRDFSYDGAFVTAVVLSYGTVEEATAARDLIFNAADGCEDLILTRSANEFESASAAQDTLFEFDSTAVDAELVRADHFSASALLTGEEEAVFNSTLLIQADERVAWVVESLTGQDNNCSILADDENIGQCRLPFHAAAIAERLVS